MKLSAAKCWMMLLPLLAVACKGPGMTVPPIAQGPTGVPGVMGALTDPATVPSAPREFRAAWIATVANIDWPSRPGLDAATQRDELRTLLDQAVVLGLNGIIFQVRTTADALYRSGLEPFSTYLTGVQGQDPGYDPLAFAVEEAHLRGLELHAWFNPFRAGHPTTGEPASSHVRATHPDWVVQYGELWWLDPGNREASAHSQAVIEDVVARYDIDGIHVDDYFYPYPIRDEAGDPVPFPDSTSWTVARAAGEGRSLADWRRSNVDDFIREMYERTKVAKPWVKVGISPFGIWRPGHPEGIRGFDQYEGLFADARKWFLEGWLDYMTPQLYWPIASEGQPYEPLLRWWAAQNAKGRHLWPGNFTSRVIPAGGSTYTTEEIVEQVRITRGITDGNVHFSMRAMVPGTGMDEALVAVGYDRPALVPETHWLGGKAPGAPVLRFRRVGHRVVIDLVPGGQEEPFVWHVRVRSGERWTADVVPAWRRSLFLDANTSAVVVSAVNRLGQEGPSVRVDV